VFANKHALALAHASEGGKCKRRVPYPRSGVERAKIRVPHEGLVSSLARSA
jgi:hypothetical protein